MRTHALNFASVILSGLATSSAHASVTEPVQAGPGSAIELQAPEESPGFDLIVLGELVATGQPARPQIPDRPAPLIADDVRLALDAVRAVGPDLIMTTGNLISAPRSEVRWIQQQEAIFEAMEAMGAPWYPVGGLSSIIKATGERDAQRLKLYSEKVGPRWYAFEHEFALLITLDTHDGGRGLVSDDQLAWLRETLSNSDASQVLVFTHADLWNQDAPSWHPVHALLGGDNRPASVFASSARAYRNDGDVDGVSYYTLGPITGRSDEPHASTYSWPHITLVRVRADRVIPVIMPTNPAPDRPGVLPADWQTGDEVERLRDLARGDWASIEGLVGANPSGALDGTVIVQLSNPTQQPLPYSVSCTSSIGAAFSPERVDGTLAAGETISWDLSVSGGTVGNSRPDDHIRIGIQYEMSNGETAQVVQRLPLPTQLMVSADAVVRATDPGLDLALELNGRSAIETDFTLPKTLTLECWARADQPRERSAVCSTIDLAGHGDGAGIFWMFNAEGSPMPGAVVRAGGSSVILRAAEPWSWDQWGHLAVTHNGQYATLFVNGNPVDQQPLEHELSQSNATLIIGASAGKAQPTMWYRGLVDEVRVSEGVRYRGVFTPNRQLAADDDARVLMHFDSADVPIGADASPSEAHGWEIGSPKRVSRTDS